MRFEGFRRAFELTVLIAAGAHLAVYFAVFGFGKSPRGVQMFNFFDLLDLEYFFPGLIEGWPSFVFSYCLLFALFAACLWFVRRRRGVS